MPQLLTVFMMIVSLLLTSYAWAGSEVDHAVSRAEIMVLKDDLEKAERVLEGSKAETRGQILKEVKDLREKLEKANETLKKVGLPKPLQKSKA